MTPIFLDLAQGSPEWHQWRTTVLGASDAGTILGINPYKTARQLWEEKTGRAEPEPENDAMRRGTALEPLARSAFELEHGITMPPTCCVTQEYPFIGASLDGYAYLVERIASVILEIKCGKAAYGQMKAGKIAPYYRAQIQQQLMVTDAEKCYFWAFDPEQGGRLGIVEPDVDFQANLLDALVKFHACLESDTPPDDDAERTDLPWLKAVQAYNAACAEMRVATELKDRAEANLIALAKSDKTRGGGILLSKVAPRTPPIKWEAAARDLADILGEPVDFEKYRPAAIGGEPTWRITKEKE